ncbi:MAG: hypothetical protein DRI84_04380 [Bacteroidetes bacterium]|nr:MAG: hypothetical protein DRI84_04380 [Bacteroidota bacterium]
MANLQRKRIHKHIPVFFIPYSGQPHTLYYELLIFLFAALKDLAIHELHEFPRICSKAAYSWNTIRANSCNSWVIEDQYFTNT